MDWLSIGVLVFLGSLAASLLISAFIDAGKGRVSRQWFAEAHRNNRLREE